MPALLSRLVRFAVILGGMLEPRWSQGAVAAPRQVTTFDARPFQRLDLRNAADARRTWDTVHLVSALQGLANREAARLYLFYCQQFEVDTDQFWFDWYRGEDGWLSDTEVEAASGIEPLLKRFRTSFDGLVVYDGSVPATANLASTAAGVERLLPVRFDAATNSIFSLCAAQLELPVRLWLVKPDGSPKFTGGGTLPDSGRPSSGSAKVDAYRWARARWLDTGRCDPHLGAYYLDAYWLQHPANAQPDMHTLANHDWFIARRGFFFDLSPWGDEAPVDDPKQSLGDDRRCLLDVLLALYRGTGGGVVKIGGFPPWPWKYTTHSAAGKHEPVATEWEFTRLISQFNAYKEADAAGLGAMANASFHQWYPLAKRYRQPASIPTRADWARRGLLTAGGPLANKLFVGHYVGDYDSPSWLYKAVPAYFRDPARGRIPLGWAFDPNLVDRAPQAMAYAYRHASPNDFFIAGDSGAGYLNVRALTARPESGLPSGLRAWQEHCQRYFAQWDMSITGFVLDGAAGAATEEDFTAYRTFSPDGCGTHFEREPAMRAGIPTCPERDLPDSATATATLIADIARANAGRPAFLWARSILKSPQWYADVSRLLAEKHAEAAVEIVDPYTFFGLIKVHLSPAR